MRFPHRNGIRAIVVGVGASTFLALGLSAGTTLVTVRVTQEPGTQYDPAIDDGLVAFTDLNAADGGDIRVYRLSDGHDFTIPSAATAQTLEDIDGKIVVYNDARGTTGLDIWAYDLATNTETAVTIAAGRQQNPAISGTRVVWEDTSAGNFDIYAGDVAGGPITQLTSHPSTQWRPAVSGNLVVWEDGRNASAGNGMDIYAYWFGTPPAGAVPGENPVSVGPGNSTNPDVDGTRVVWQQNVDGNEEIFLYDFATGETRRITSHPANQTRPRISGNLIVWEDARNDLPDTEPKHPDDKDLDLYGFDLTTNQEIVFVSTSEHEALHDVDVRADGGYDIAYTVDFGGGDSDIFVLRAFLTPDPTPEPTPDPDPAPSGDPCDPSSGAEEYFAETFERSHGQPLWESRTFAAAAGSGTVCLTLEHVTAAWVKLEGETLFTPDDFNPHVTSARADVSLTDSNHLQVRLAGKPCGDHEDDCDDDDDRYCDDDDCPTPHSGSHGDRWRGSRRGHHGHHDDDHDDDEDGDDDRDDDRDDDGDDDDRDDEDDDHDHDGTCARMTVRVVGPVPASFGAGANLAGSATAANGGGAACSVVATNAGSPWASLLLLAGAALLVRPRRRQ